MTPITTSVLPIVAPKKETSHKFLCCFGCRCINKISAAPDNFPQVEAITRVYDISIRLPACPPAPRLIPRKEEQDVPPLPVRSRSDNISEGYRHRIFEPRNFLEIDIWFEPLTPLDLKLQG